MKKCPFKEKRQLIVLNLIAKRLTADQITINTSSFLWALSSLTATFSLFFILNFSLTGQWNWGLKTASQRIRMKIREGTYSRQGIHWDTIQQLITIWPARQIKRHKCRSSDKFAVNLLCLNVGNEFPFLCRALRASLQTSFTWRGPSKVLNLWIDRHRKIRILIFNKKTKSQELLWS